MREKINIEVAIVREEVRAGRLHWTSKDLSRLIKPFPTRREVDAALEKNRTVEEAWRDDGEVAYAEGDETDGEPDVAVSDVETFMEGEPDVAPDGEPAVAEAQVNPQESESAGEGAAVVEVDT